MSNTDTSRRRALGYLAELLSLAIGLLVAAPAVAYLFSPFLRRRGRRSEPALEDVAPLSDLPVGQWRLLPLDVVRQDGWKETRERHSVWVRRQKGSSHPIMVLSPICPHLGCPVAWHPEKREFICPCHGGTFDAKGHYVSGPPPRSMDPLQFKVRDGSLWVHWQDFKIGVAKRIPVSV